MPPFNPPARTLSASSELLKLTDRCVMCGLCLPHCPTYLKTRDEGESPRGRIALIQGLLKQRLTPSPRLEAHLDHCLACRACEPACPSGVPYGEIIDGARAHLATAHPQQNSARRAALNLLTNKTKLRTLGAALRFYQRTGLRGAARKSGLLKILNLERADGLLPPLAPLPAWRRHYPARGVARGEVALFTGCAADVFDRPALKAALDVLTRVGYGVHIPPAQTCCGALHRHNGDPARAAAFAARNRNAFAAPRVEAIITTASGCGVELKDLPAPVMDISQFLATRDWPAHAPLAPLPARVAVHDPCTLSYPLRQQDKPYALLRRIPRIELIPLPGNTRCCGAAGSYMLREPAMADALREDKIAALKELNVSTLVTSNPGCALHLRAGIAAAGLNIEVLHPIELFARQIQG